MEAAVREFLNSVSSYLEDSLSSAGVAPPTASSSQRQQLQLLRKQLQLLLDRFPGLRAVAEENTYDETDDLSVSGVGGVLGGGVAGTGRQRGFNSAGNSTDSSGGNSGDSTTLAEATRLAADELYDDTVAPPQHIEQETYDDISNLPIPEEEYDDVTAAPPYVPMFKTDTLNSNQHSSKVNPPLPLDVGPPPVSAPPKPVPEASGAASVSGSQADLSVAPSLSSLASNASSDESAGVQPQPAAQLKSIASRWGRLELKQNSKLKPYRRYWAGLVESRLLLYQKETDPAHRLSVNLTQYEVRRPPAAADVKEKHRPLCFELVKPGGKTQTLLGVTPKDARQWMAALERVTSADSATDAGGRQPQNGQPAPCRPPASLPLDVPIPAAQSLRPATHSPVATTQNANDEVIEESLYNVPTDEEQIYDDVTLITPPPAREESERHSLIQEEIYETIQSPGADGHGGTAPPFDSGSDVRGAPQVKNTPLLPRSVDVPLPPRPPQRAPIPEGHSPQLPTRPPPQQPPPSERNLPPLPSRSVPPTLSQTPPPLPPTRAPALPARPQPPGPPPSRPPPPLPSQPPPTQQEGATEEIYDEMTEPIQEDLYDEMGPGSSIAASTDPFYNILEPENEYNKPPHPSPVPFRTAVPTEEPSDEGYGNSSGGSESECRSVGDSHYKTLPLLRPVPVPTTKQSDQVRSPPKTLQQTAPAAVPARKDAKTLLSTEKVAHRVTAEVSAEGKKPAASAAQQGSSVRDAIARLNRRSVSDEGAAPAAYPVTISADLARKQALIAPAIQKLDPQTPTSPLSKQAPATPRTAYTKDAKKPSVTHPKPTIPGPIKKVSGVTSADRTPTAGNSGKAAQPERPGMKPAEPVPNKSGLYTVMRQSLGRQPMSLAVHPQVEEEDVYAEIDELPGAQWTV